MSNVTLELLRRLRSGGTEIAKEDLTFREGKASGINWAQNNIFCNAQRPPLSLNLMDSPYNAGVMRGIALELRRVADRLDPARPLGQTALPKLLCAPAETHLTPNSASFVPLEEIIRRSTIDTEA